ncbi:MAG: hypothetical protein ABIA56_05230 [Actinomycetota bacterium]
MKPFFCFDHIDEYDSFEDFKKDVIRFFMSETLQNISHNSWDFFCFNNFTPKKLYKQVNAINKVLDGLYGKGKVRWGQFRADDCPPASYNKFLGSYIEVNNESFSLDMPYRYTLNTFINRRLRR